MSRDELFVELAAVLRRAGGDARLPGQLPRDRPVASRSRRRCWPKLMVQAHAEALEAVRAPEVKHVDETGWKQAGQRRRWRRS
jgi:hypothetical protein